MASQQTQADRIARSLKRLGLRTEPNWPHLQDRRQSW
jgi:hypothetical protein